MDKRRRFFVLGLALAAVGAGSMFFLPKKCKVKFEESSQALVNPLMGYAPPAEWYDEEEKVSLLYMDITWRELEPREGEYAWEQIEADNQLDKWREQGKHIVLRFVMDKPSEERHMDIPEWLYDKMQKKGDWYDMEYGQGFSPDYSDETLIACHEKAVKAMGEHFGQDGFISYIELGSLGHWGEWHVNYDAGIKRLPLSSVREEYVMPWKEAFPYAMLLMRRPFAVAEQEKYGLFNDMTGEPDSTAAWLDWINNGGEYEQTGEPKGLLAMPDFWKNAPSGGEFTSSLSMEEMLSDQLERTLQLINESHTTFLGPKIADETYSAGYEAVLKNMGYRLWISEAVLETKPGKYILKLTWKNTGCAPFYQNWTPDIYILDESGSILSSVQIDMELSRLLPGETCVTQSEFFRENADLWKNSGDMIAVGISDPMTGEPCVKFAMKGEEETVLPVILRKD